MEKTKIGITQRINGYCILGRVGDSLNQHLTCSYFNTLENRQKRSSDRGTALGGRQSLGPGDWWPPVEAPGYGGRRLAGRGAGAAEGLAASLHLHAPGSVGGAAAGMWGWDERRTGGDPPATGRRSRDHRTAAPERRRLRAAGSAALPGSVAGRSRSDRGYGREVLGVRGR